MGKKKTKPNDIDEVIEILEAKAKANEAEAKKEELGKAITHIESHIEYSKEDAKIRKKSERKRRVEARRKERRKNLALTFTTVALAVLLIKAGITGIKGIIRNIHNNRVYKAGYAYFLGKAKENLLKNGLATEDPNTGEIIIKDNSIKDYACLNLTDASALERYIYFEALGQEESNDAVQTIPLNDETSDRYIGYDQYLTYNGFFTEDPGTGVRTPSHIEEIVYFKNPIIEAFTSGEEVVRTPEEIEESRGTGGRSH